MQSQEELVVALAATLGTIREQFALLDTATSPLYEAYSALNHVEQLLFEHKDDFGIMTIEFQQGCEEFVLLSNSIAMQSLRDASQQQLKLCGELLERAEQHTRRSGYLKTLPGARRSRRVQFRLLCLNNLACCYRQQTKPLAAIVCLEKMLKLQTKQQSVSLAVDQDSPAQQATASALTHLNLCAVLSELRRHATAAEHARAAIALLQSESSKWIESGEDAAQESNSEMLVVAHYNLAVELEFQHEPEAALRTYQLAHSIARACGMTRDSSDVVQNIERILTQQGGSGKTSLSPRKWGIDRPISPHSIRQLSS